MMKLAHLVRASMVPGEGGGEKIIRGISGKIEEQIGKK
jgi:ABC-type proline/glycine betaine transport system permease subunit